MGDAPGSGFTRSLGNAIKDACRVRKDWWRVSEMSTE
jgi:hypothetical protein